MKESTLAIVIPYYKIDFFEETLKSVAAQTDKRFTLYIGNDASPHDPLPLIQKYFPDGNYNYYDYKDNLGGKNLAMQWERILENVTEEWFQILGDDDMISGNFVEEFYLKYDNFRDVNLIKSASIIIDENKEVLHSKSLNFLEGMYNIIDFFLEKQEGKINSSLSEHIFRNCSFQKVKFTKYPLAWHSDDFILLQIGIWNPEFYFLRNTLVTVKETTKSISGSKQHNTAKDEAKYTFYKDCLKHLKTYGNAAQKERFANIIIKFHPKIPAKEVFLRLYPMPFVIIKLLVFYIHRIILKAKTNR